MTNPATLIATIGTRDLMYQIQTGTWYNIGDDRMQDGDIIGEQAEVLLDLAKGSLTYREMTQYLWENWANFQNRVRPVILGKLIQDNLKYLKSIYLIGTDQPETVTFRKRDTIYSCHIIKAWIQAQEKSIDVKIISLGEDGTNPSEFESMFQWWGNQWDNAITVSKDYVIWMGLKGGVGQTSESGRISSLSRYGDRIQFFEFDENSTKNREGIPSEYRGPFLGKNYLWDRAVQQARRSLERYDYVGAEETLQDYRDRSEVEQTQQWIKAGIVWNKGQFSEFVTLAKNHLTSQQKEQCEKFWWMAYEEMYLAKVRFEQGNTVEAFLHSFRALEGLCIEWIKFHYPNMIEIPDGGSPFLKKRPVITKFPSLNGLFTQGDRAKLENHVRKAFIEVADPRIKDSDNFRPFWGKAREERNTLSHDISGLTDHSFLRAWSVRNPTDWHNRMVKCLNLLSEQRFVSLQQASLFASLHHRILRKL